MTLPPTDVFPTMLESLKTEGKWKRVAWSGNPPISPMVMGWTVRLGRYTTQEEKDWFHENGFAFHGGKWGRPDNKG